MIKHRIDVSEPKKKAESDIDSLFRTVEKRDVFRKEVGPFRKTSQKFGILEGAIFYFLQYTTLNTKSQRMYFSFNFSRKVLVDRN